MSDCVRYRIHTQDQRGLSSIVSLYFAGATIIAALGLWKGDTESAAIIEILGTRDDRQNVIHLAGDIRFHNHQESVIVTWETVSRFDVTV